MTHIDYETARDGLLDLVEEFGPEYKYEEPPDASTCQYSHGDTPGCIIGHFLHRQGMSLAELGALDKLKNPTFGNLQRSDLPFELTEDAALFLSDVQRGQDGGIPWSLAVDEAITEMEETE